jgi:hypothetical protein
MAESSDFSTVLCKDDRIAKITDAVKYSVFKGGSNVTFARYKAISGVGAANPTSLVFNLQVPSEQVVVDRAVKMVSTFSFDVSVILPGAGASFNALIGSRPFDYGNNCSLGPYPVHSLFSSMNVTINNNSTSVQQQQVLPALMRLYDERVHQRAAGGAPNTWDTCADYTQLVNATSNPLGGFDNVADTDIQPRGSWYISQSGAGNALIGGGDAGTTRTITITATTEEYVQVSPFIFNKTYHDQGFLGIQTLNMQFQIGSPQRLFRHSGLANNGAVINAASAVTVGNLNILNSELVFNFLSLHPSDVLPSRNVVPYYDLPLYQTTASITSLASMTGTNDPTGFIQTSTFSLNQIPDKLMIWVSPKAFGTYTTQDADAWMVIDNISIQFNNSQGLLSNCDSYDLWKMSVAAGSNQSWSEWSGQSLKASAGAAPTRLRMCGSLLVLDMAKDVQLSDDFLAPGSIGQYSLSLQIRFKNPFSYAVTTPVCTIMTLNSGLWVVDRGQSSSFSGILTKALVLDASQKESVPREMGERIVGGALHRTAASMGPVMGSAAPAFSGITGTAKSSGLQARFK